MVFERISRDVILKVGGMFNANDYWKKREKISEKMLYELNKELNKAYSTCENLQLLNIELPRTFEDSIVTTQVEVQKINMRKFEQTAELIRQNISVLISEAEQKIKITNSTGIAEAYKIKKEAESQIINNTISVEKDIVSNIKKELNMDNKEILEYLYLNRINQQNNKKLVVGFGENNNNLILNVNDNK
jgi:regulator of protease activity HflC (stomatin/prohibitin superfamily)